MSDLSIEQIRGIKDLIHDAVIITVNTTEDTHHALARPPYAVLRRVPGIARPAALIEQTQIAITRSAYQAVRTLAALTALLATQMIDRMGQE